MLHVLHFIRKERFGFLYLQHDSCNNRSIVTLLTINSINVVKCNFSTAASIIIHLALLDCKWQKNQWLETYKHRDYLHATSWVEWFQITGKRLSNISLLVSFPSSCASPAERPHTVRHAESLKRVQGRKVVAKRIQWRQLISWIYTQRTNKLCIIYIFTELIVKSTFCTILWAEAACKLKKKDHFLGF